MTANRGKVFTAELRKQAAQGRDASIGELTTAIRSLEHRISRDIVSQFDRLFEKMEMPEEKSDDQAALKEIMAEIHSMNEHIHVTKQEVAALKPADEAHTTITATTEELGEVVKATERAANTILENAEQIDHLVAQLRGKVPEGDPDGVEPDIDKLEYVGMELLTACSFQDITGQRITKVVNALSHIEERLKKIIDIWRIDQGTADFQEMAFHKEDEREDKDMLHGPQSLGMGQDDIDALFD